MSHVEGAPPGTRGGISVDHTFVADGDYVFSMDFFAEPLGFLFGNTRPGEEIEVSIDGARLAIFQIDPRMSEEKTGLTLKTAPMHVKAGTHRVTAAFIQRFDGLINDLIAPIDHTMADTEIGIAPIGITTLPHLRSLSVIGPHRVTGVSDTPSRRRKCFSAVRRHAGRRTTCAADHRSPPLHAGVSPAGRGEGPRAVDDVLCARPQGRAELRAWQSPRRLKRSWPARSSCSVLRSTPTYDGCARGRSPQGEGRSYRLADYELASRLSFFLWGRGPDAELLKARCCWYVVHAWCLLRRQAKRMLAVPGTDALGARFASQWLRLAGPREGASRIRSCIPTPTRRCRLRSRPKRSCSSTASCVTIAACLIC